MSETRPVIIAAHFPEYVGQVCLCGRPLANVADWANHLDEVLTTEEAKAGYPLRTRAVSLDEIEAQEAERDYPDPNDQVALGPKDYG